MFSNKFSLKYLAIFTFIVLVSGCSDDKAVANKTSIENTTKQFIALEVYKSPTCGCCHKGIQPRHRSCHTAISKNGYVFEGHVPAKFIQQFLEEKHENDVIGLSVPAMPLGSLGMEVGDKFHPYKVLLLKSEGSYETYANVQSYEEQF